MKESSSAVMLGGCLEAKVTGDALYSVRSVAAYRPP